MTRASAAKTHGRSTCRDNGHAVTNGHADEALRSPPHHIPSEVATLGGILRNDGAMTKVAPLLRPTDFFRDVHGQVFRAMLEIWQSTGGVDEVALDELLVFRKVAPPGETSLLISELMEGTPGRGENVLVYAHSVLAHAERRAALEVAQRLEDAAYRGLETADEAIDRATERLAEIKARTAASRGSTFSLDLMGSATFASKVYVREYLVERFLVRGQPGIVGGPKKGMKTTLMIDLCVSLASATRFLGEFVVPRPTKTLFISGESGDATTQETWRRVCKSKGIDPDETEGTLFWGFTLPQLGHAEHLEALEAAIQEHGIEVVVLDPLYLSLASDTGKVDHANLFDVGPLLLKIAKICLDAGATPILVHHLRKNRENPHDPPELEDLAFAGVQEFARQWVMLGRREAYEPGTGEHQLWLSVGGSAGHSGAWAVDISEGVMDENFSERQWNVRVFRATDARAEAKARDVAVRAEKAAEKNALMDDAKAKRIQDDAVTALLKLRSLKDQRATKTQWRESIGTWDSRRFNAALAWLLEHGRVAQVEVTVKAGAGSKSVPGFAPSPQPISVEPGSNPDEPG